MTKPAESAAWAEAVEWIRLILPQGYQVAPMVKDFGILHRQEVVAKFDDPTEFRQMLELIIESAVAGCTDGGADGLKALVEARDQSRKLGIGPMATITPEGPHCEDCGDIVPWGGWSRRCSCGTVMVLGNGVRLTPKSVASRTIPIELVRGRTT